MKEILKQLESINGSSYSVFDDWLDLMLYCLMSNDEAYMKVATRYKGEIDYFSNAFGLLMQEMSETNDELLGEIYMNWNINNKYTGQFFTPKPIARMMAEITQPHGNISDPCCGAGIMLVEACKIMTDLDTALFVAQDIDYTCVRMCALNMTFFNLNSYIILGNSLSMEYRKVFQTKRTYLGGIIRELSEEEIEVIRPKIQRMEVNTFAKGKLENQLNLFEV